MTPVSPTEKRKEKNEERKEATANACPKCNVGRFVEKTVGVIFKKTVQACDKCGYKKEF